MSHTLRTFALGIAVLLLGVAVVLAVANPVLLLREISALVRGMPRAEAERARADHVPSAPSEAYRTADDPAAARTSASEMPRPEAPVGPQPDAAPDPEAIPPIAGEQRVLRSRKALETVDARELLRQANTPK